MEYAVARDAFKRAIELDGQRPIAYVWASRMGLLMGDRRGAEAAAQAAMKALAPDSPEKESLIAAAALADARNDRDAAERYYRELAGQNLDSPDQQLELAGFLKRQSRNEQAVEAYHEALKRDGSVGRAHVELCQLYSALDDYPLSEQHAQAALKRFRETQNRTGEAQALLCYGDALLQQGTRVAEAKTHIESARLIFESLNQPYNLSRAYQYLGYLAARERNYPAAIAAFEQALSGSRETGNRQLEGLELMNLGLAHVRMGRVAEAVRHFQEGRDVYQQLGDERRSAELDVLAAGLQIDYGSNVTDALRRLASARATLRKLGHADFEVLSMQIEALHLRNSGRFQDALKLLHQALALAMERNLTDKIHSLNTDIGLSQFALSQFDAARKTLDEAIRGGSPEPRIALARLYVRLRNLPGAQHQLDAAAKDIQSTGELMLMPQFHLALGELALESGAPQEARAYFIEAARPWTVELANAATSEARCYLGFLGRQAPLIETTITRSQRLGWAPVENFCRKALSRQLNQGAERLSQK
jgi:tetratricopeptide (TPR) repeat protein